ncbi:MAG: PH domain-containing protein, partial [Treponema sp.]|nr:PH domain-containing protein [Treponema sp.]
DKSSKKAKQSGTNPSGNEKEDNFPKEKEKLPKKVQKGESKALGKSFYTIMFFLFMLFIIIWQNLKAKKKTGNYENPYVDTKKYKLPLDANFKIPTVHFTKIELEENEKIIFATETTQKNQEGDFVVTDKRIIVLGKSENYEIPLQELTTVSSVTNSVMQITSGTQKYYIFVPENQIKFAVATVHWILEKKF